MKQDDPPHVTLMLRCGLFWRKKTFGTSVPWKLMQQFSWQCDAKGPEIFPFLNYITEQLQRDSPYQLLPEWHESCWQTHPLCLQCLECSWSAQAGKGGMIAGKSVGRAGGWKSPFGFNNNNKICKAPKFTYLGRKSLELNACLHLCYYGEVAMVHPVPSRGESPAFKCRSAKASVWTWWNVWRSCLPNGSFCKHFGGSILG